MESPPPATETDSESTKRKESGKKKKKSAEAIGVFAVEPKSEAPAVARDDETKSEYSRRREQSSEETEAGHETGEAEIPPEQLSPDERHYVELETVEALQAAETGELPAPVESFRRKIIEGQPSEQALVETLEELARPDELSPPGDAEPLLETVEAEPLTDSPQEFDEEAVYIPRYEANDSDAAKSETGDDNEDIPPTLDDVGAGRGTPSPVSPPPRGGGARGPGGPAWHPGLAPNNYSRPVQTAGRTEYVPVYNGSDVLSAALLGGIIGYLIGRRRGRIKTEKKLLPVQKKLEKEVKGLQQNLQFNETRLRKVAAEKTRGERALAATQLHREVVEYQSTERHRPAAPEARQLHATPLASEKIGHVLIAAEADQSVQSTRSERLAPPKPERSRFEQRAEAFTAATTDNHVETMSRSELLSLSEKVRIDGSSLRQVYETHLIGERGLRRLVGEHLRGGDLKKALRREVVEREIDFERDPLMRDHAPQAASEGSAHPMTLDSLLQKAGAAPLGDAEEVAFLKARATYEASQQQSQHKHRRLADTGLAAIITVLIALVIILYLTRS